MTYTAEFDTVDAEEWHQLLQEFDDASIFQTWAYGAAHWGEANLSHAVIKLDGEAIGLAQVVLVGIPVLGKILAYVLFGPICQRHGTVNRSAHLMATIAALREEYVERRHLCLRLRPWAYDLPNDAGSTILSAFREARALHKTYILDLSRSEAELRALMDKKWRANLRKAERSGLAVTTCGDNNDGVKIFIELHKQMCERKAFRSAFDDSYLACQMQLPEAIRPLIFVCRQGDSPVAAAVVSAIGNRAIMLNAASGDAALSVRAGYLLQWTIVRWLKESGRYCWYDLNDSRSSPGVRQFKRGLVGAKAPEIAMSEFMTCKSHAFSRMLETSIRLRELCHQ